MWIVVKSFLSFFDLFASFNHFEFAYLAGKPFTGKIVNQIDIAATISSFFDLAIPVQR